MFTNQDLKQMAARGTSPETAERQLEQIATGFPFLKLDGAATVGKGVVKPSEAEENGYVSAWHDYKTEGHSIVKFVPASGAASRMFKDMFAFLDADYNEPTTAMEKQFFEGFKHFAFRQALRDKCKTNEGLCPCKLIEAGRYKDVVKNMLTEQGLNYGKLPKGLLLFHEYEDGQRTPFEEHLVEAALYAASDGKAKVHFTVSPDHLPLFKALADQLRPKYEEKYGISYDISFSVQKASTDTIAANPDGSPFRNSDGSLLFRPGGHGALIENLGEVDADVVFIKNIDNVVPDHLKGATTRYKEVIGGVLVTLQKKCFEYLRLLDSGSYSHDQLEEVIRFLQRDLCCRRADIKQLEDADLVVYLRKKLNRPMRVCGMVRNQGEPGGGPFLAYNPDGTVSLQILESSQIDKRNADYQKMFSEGSHFNPVDLVCATKDYKGQPFKLSEYVDKQTGFISQKSKDGKPLQALELPGLWNGAMSDWNTVFVEVPIETFNPVKTVCDLLRPQHQPAADATHEHSCEA